MNLDAVTNALSALLLTPNGRLFSLGAVLMVGPAYYVFARDFEDVHFAYAVMGLGVVAVSVSIVMAIVKAKKDAER